MSFANFKAYLATQYISPQTASTLGTRTAGDYVSRLRRIQRLTNQPVEGESPDNLRTLADQLESHQAVLDELKTKDIVDARVALRNYANYQTLNSVSSTGDEGSARVYDAEGIETDLKTLGFSSATPLAHVYELQRKNTVIYVKRQTSHQRLVIHPDYELNYSRLCIIPGVTRRKEPKFGFYHNSSMKQFPRLQHSGTTLIHYGLDFSVVDSSALSQLVRVLEEISSGNFQASNASTSDNPTTETKRLFKARLGQGDFRAALIEYWEGSCPLTGIQTPELLRASHIKPWSKSSPREQLDPFNGLLLSIHFDILFDQGFISFTDEGEILLAGALGATERMVFGLHEDLPRLSLATQHTAYIAYHREHVFLGAEALTQS